MVNGSLTTSATFVDRLAIGIAATVLLVPATPAAAAPAPAGSMIESTAEASYVVGGINRTIASNTVEVRVDELLAVAAATLDSGPVTVRSGPQVLDFLVSNTGNGSEAFALEVITADAGNAFEAALDAVAIDSNDNGVYDPGVDEVLSAPHVTAALPAGGSQRVFAILAVPGGLADGAQSVVDLVVRTATGTGAPGTIFAGAGDNGGDAVVGASAGTASATGTMIASASTVTLVKWASVSDPLGGSSPFPGATITYGITAQVTGSAPIEGLTIVDAIPQGTSYVADSLTLESGALTDAPGDDPGEASAAGIAVDLGTVPAGASRTVTFAVLID